MQLYFFLKYHICFRIFPELLYHLLAVSMKGAMESRANFPYDGLGIRVSLYNIIVQSSWAGGSRVPSSYGLGGNEIA